MSAHTPGPYIARNTEVHGFAGVQVAWCGRNSTVGTGGSHSISLDEVEANTMLFASAPDLLAAVKFFVEYDDAGNVRGENAVDLYVDAIARAGWEP